MWSILNERESAKDPRQSLQVNNFQGLGFNSARKELVIEDDTEEEEEIIYLVEY